MVTPVPAQSQQPRGHVHPLGLAGAWSLRMPEPHSHWHEGQQWGWLPVSLRLQLWLWLSPGSDPIHWGMSGCSLCLGESRRPVLPAWWRGKGYAAELEALPVAGTDADIGASRAGHCLRMQAQGRRG